MSDWNDKIIAEFRDNDGKVGGPFEGAHLLLLTTTGAKSGKPRVSPMVFFVEPEGTFVVASKGGAPSHPGWFHNLKANPTVDVEMSTPSGIETFSATAARVDDSIRDDLFARLAARNPAFASYQKKTDRKIPVVSITRN
ncbi:MAG: nitroreductase family deazaflavin-dependent oxidoreductase [Rhodoglobus sp.]